jgi:hypothetical protein
VETQNLLKLVMQVIVWPVVLLQLKNKSTIIYKV